MIIGDDVLFDLGVSINAKGGYRWKYVVIDDKGKGKGNDTYWQRKETKTANALVNMLSLMEKENIDGKGKHCWKRKSMEIAMH